MSVNTMINKLQLKKCWNIVTQLVKDNKLVRYALIGIGILLVLLVILTALSSHHTLTQQHIDQLKTWGKARVTLPAKNPVTQQLQKIATKLAAIEQRLSQKSPVMNLDPIRQELSSVQSQTAELAKQSDALLSQQIKHSTKTLSEHLQAINSKLDQLESEKKQAVYLTPSHLPFSVLHIDNIQQQNVVTVRYNHTAFPINIGDYLAGWKLIGADFANQTAEFVNKKAQHVVLNLNRIKKERT